MKVVTLWSSILNIKYILDCFERSHIQILLDIVAVHCMYTKTYG